MGLIYQVKRLNRIVDACAFIENNSASNLGVFAGNIKKFSEYIVKRVETQKRPLFDALENRNAFLNPYVWAVYAVANFAEKNFEGDDFFESTDYSVNFAFCLFLLSDLLKYFEEDMNARALLNAIESEVVQDCLEIRAKLLSRYE